MNTITFVMSKNSKHISKKKVHNLSLIIFFSPCLMEISKLNGSTLTQPCGNSNLNYSSYLTYGTFTLLLILISRIYNLHAP